MTVGEAQKLAKEKLEPAQISSHHLDALILLEKITGLERSWLMGHPEHALPHESERQFRELIVKRACRIPMVHLTNTKEFYGLDFFVNEDVLSPRAETEKMVEWVIKYAPRNSRLLDVGTGSGAIAIAIAKNRPDLSIKATDVTDEALEVAAKNAKRLQVKIQLLKSDLFGYVDGKFETVVTNLPYLKNDAELMPEVAKEPKIALFGGNDGLDIYRQFFHQLPSHLERAGFLFTECDPWQQADLIRDAKAIGLRPFKEDYFILGFQGK